MDRFKIANSMTIQEVSTRMQIPKSTLRYWEKEFGKQIQPDRTQGGQRRYRIEHLEIFERIRDMRNMGKPLSDIKGALSLTADQKPKTNPQHDLFIDKLTQRITTLVKREVMHFLRGVNQ